MSDESEKVARSSSNVAGSRRRRRGASTSKAKDLRVYLSDEERKRLDELALEYGSQAEAIRRALDLLLDVKRENQLGSKLDQIHSGLRHLRDTASCTQERGEYSITLQKSVEKDLKNRMDEHKDSLEVLHELVTDICWDLRGFLATIKTSAEARAKTEQLRREAEALA